MYMALGKGWPFVFVAGLTPVARRKGLWQFQYWRSGFHCTYFVHSNHPVSLPDAMESSLHNGFIKVQIMRHQSIAEPGHMRKGTQHSLKRDANAHLFFVRDAVNLRYFFRDCKALGPDNEVGLRDDTEVAARIPFQNNGSELDKMRLAFVLGRHVPVELAGSLGIEEEIQTLTSLRYSTGYESIHRTSTDCI